MISIVLTKGALPTGEGWYFWRASADAGWDLVYVTRLRNNAFTAKTVDGACLGNFAGFWSNEIEVTNAKTASLPSLQKRTKCKATRGAESVVLRETRPA